MSQQTIDINHLVEKITAAGGDLATFSPAERSAYYVEICRRIGLDPLTAPFSYMTERGKVKLYCDRGGAAQIARVHKISIKIPARETSNGCYVVTANASTPEGPEQRCTESIGAVPIENKRGEDLSNAMMKAETKAKRRAILDLIGLGMLDEIEAASVSTATFSRPGEEQQAANGQPQASAGANGGNNGSGGSNTPPAPPQGGNGPQGPQGGHLNVDPWKVTYKTIDEVATQLLNGNGDKKQIANLYFANAALVDQHPEVKSKFSERRDQLLAQEQSSQTANRI